MERVFCRGGRPCGAFSYCYYYYYCYCSYYCRYYYCCCNSCYSLAAAWMNFLTFAWPTKSPKVLPSSTSGASSMDWAGPDSFTCSRGTSRVTHYVFFS